MTSFMGEISVDGMKICIENSDSYDLSRCLIIANALSNALMSGFVESIVRGYDEPTIEVWLKTNARSYAPAIYFIANRCLGHEVKVFMSEKYY